MTEPTFTDGPPVPLMVDGNIDAATLRQLFADLSAFATILAVREKGDPTAFTRTDSLTPDSARARLLSGDARAVQIHYRFAGHEWTDTVFAISSGFRVVRCRHEHKT